VPQGNKDQANGASKTQSVSSGATGNKTAVVGEKGVDSNDHGGSSHESKEFRLHTMPFIPHKLLVF